MSIGLTERLSIQSVSSSSEGGGEDIGTATVISALPYVDDGTTVGALDDYDEACPDASTSADVVYAYTPVANDTLVITLCGSVLDTKVFVYENSEATLVDCNDDYCGDQSELGFVEVTAGNTYYIVVDGWGGDEGSYHLEVFKWDPARCLDGDVAEGEPCGTDTNDGSYGLGVYGTFDTNTTICGNLWAEGGVCDNDVFHYEVTNPLGEVITWNAVADQMDYYIMILDELCTGYYDYDASAVGEPTMIELYLGPGIYSTRITPHCDSAECYGFGCGANPKDTADGNWRYRLSMANRVIHTFDDCEEAIQITASGTYVWDLAGMTPGESMVGFVGKNVWFEFVPPSIGIAHVEMDINEALVYHVGMAAGAKCGGGAIAAAGTPWGSPAPYTMEFPSIPGSNTIIEVAAHAPDSFVYSGWLDITILPIHSHLSDVCLDGPVDLGTGDVYDYFFHNVEATTTYYPGDWFDQGLLGADIWFTWTATMTGEVQFSTCNSDPGFDSRAALYEGGQCLETTPRQPIAGNDDGCGDSGGMSAFWFEATAGQTYLLRIGGWYRDPDYLPPSQGTGYLSFTEGVTLTHPTNDDCADITPFVLSDGVVVSEYGDQTGMSNNSCLILDATTWHAFTPDTCMDLEVNYDGTYESFNWLIDDYLLDDCPCYGANQVIGLQAYYPDPDAAQPGNYSHSAAYSDLLPKTYYYPAYTGVEDYIAEDYQINFIGTGKKCDYCAATANHGVCDFGYEYIDGIVLEELSNLGNGCAGYQDFTNVTPPVLYRGVSHLLTIDLGDAIGTDTTGVWVDWNQDFDLSVAADWVATTSDGNGGEGPWFATLTPPLDAMLVGEGLSGRTLLRVRCNDGGVDDPFPCGSNVYGEVEDYVVEVRDWIDKVDTLLIYGETSLSNIVANTPLFVWSYKERLNFVQAEFEIAVGTDDDWDVAEMWEPPTISSADTAILYGGAALVDGNTYYARLRLSNGTGWTDWYETAFRMNTAPDVPAVLSPEDGWVSGSIPELWLTNVSDAEADSLSYDFELYMDLAMEWIVKDTQAVPETTDSTGWNTGVTLTDNEPFWWRSRSYDGYEYSEWSDLAVFYVNGTEQPPTAPETILPPDTSGLPVWDMVPTFTWSEASDPDPFDTLFYYQLEIALDSNFTYKNDIDSIWATNYELADSLAFGTRYWWRVSACDATDLCSTSEPGDFWTWTLGDMDHSYEADITDLSILIDNQFLTLTPIYPAFVGDVTGDCQIDITDISRFIDHLFLTLGPLEVGCE